MRYLLLLSLLLTGCIGDGAKTDVEDSTEDGFAISQGNCFCDTRGGVAYIEKTKYKYAPNLYEIRCESGSSRLYSVDRNSTVIYGTKKGNVNCAR